MKIGIIINPISGRRGRRADTGALRLAHAHRLIARPQIEADVVLTTSAGHAALLARDYVAKNFDVVAAWGGDGTVNEVAGPLIATRTALAVIPSGSGDGLAKGLRLPANADDAFHAAVAGPTTSVDIGYLGERHFLNVAGIGFDAAVATAFNRRRKRGLLAYVSGSLQRVWSYAPGRYQIHLNHETYGGEYFLIAFANGRQYGNGIVIAPQADARDGWLDAVLVQGGSPWRQLWRARRLAIGRDRPAEGVHRARVQTAEVSGEWLECHVDGETFEARGTLNVRVAPGALRIRGVAGL